MGFVQKNKKSGTLPNLAKNLKPAHLKEGKQAELQKHYEVKEEEEEEEEE